jgi:hypothetical protein
VILLNGKSSVVRPLGSSEHPENPARLQAGALKKSLSKTQDTLALAFSKQKLFFEFCEA